MVSWPQNLKKSSICSTGVSMDIKLHSQTGERSDWQAHREFLQIANRVNSYVKVVVGPETTDLELQLSADLVSTVDSSIPIIIQPVTRENQVGIKVKRPSADAGADVRDSSACQSYSADACLSRSFVKMIISEMTMQEFEDGLGKTLTVLIPFGSTEEHGRHLPLDTDTLQAISVGRKASAPAAIVCGASGSLRRLPVES